MALVPEDGTGLANADSFISLADAETYFTNHGSPASWSVLSDAAKESALRYASKWLGARYLWLGVIAQNDSVSPQALAWPRYGVVDREWRSVASDAVPQAVKDATCEAALAHVDAVLNEIRDRGGEIESVSVGPISVSYFDSAPVGRSFPYIDLLLAGLYSMTTESGAVGSGDQYIFPAPGL